MIIKETPCRNLVELIMSQNTQDFTQTSTDLKLRQEIKIDKIGNKLRSLAIDIPEIKISNFPTFEAQGLKSRLSPSLMGTQRSPKKVQASDPQCVSFHVFETTILKLQQQIQHLEMNNNVVDTLTDQCVVMEQRIQNLEQLIHMDQNLFQLRHIRAPSQDQMQQDNDDNNEDHQIRRVQSNMMDEISSLRKEMKRDIYDRFEDVERYIHKFISQAKDIDDKVSTLQDKQKQNTDGISSNEENANLIFKQIESFKQDCFAQFSNLNKESRYVPPMGYHQSMTDVKDQITKIDHDIVKIFTFVKKLLDLDSKTTKMSKEMDNLRFQGNDCRLKVKEMQRLIYSLQI